MEINKIRSLLHSGLCVDDMIAEEYVYSYEDGDSLEKDIEGSDIEFFISLRLCLYVVKSK